MDMLVKDVMNPVVAVDEDISIKEAAQIMVDRSIGSLLILKCGKVFGIITEKDIVKNVQTPNKKISSIMSTKIINIQESEELDNAALLMSKNKIKRLPVMDGDKLVGIITSSDLIAHAEDLDEDFFFG